MFECADEPAKQEWHNNARCFAVGCFDRWVTPLACRRAPERRTPCKL